MSVFKFSSLNVRGLRNREKKRSIFEYLEVIIISLSFVICS